MAQVGQIVYNIEDYMNTGGYVSSASTNPLSNRVYSMTDSGEENPNYNNQKIEIYTSKKIFQQLGFTDSITISKLGIQAPPGTKVHLNNGTDTDNEKIIMIGRTGVYELDENILIKDIYFEHPKNFILDEEKTASSLAAGIKGFKKAEEERQNSYTLLKSGENPFTGASVEIDSTEYWNLYTQIQNVYLEKYNIALGQYNTGINGIYVLPVDENGNIDEEKAYKDLLNVIVDFLY